MLNEREEANILKLDKRLFFLGLRFLSPKIKNLKPHPFGFLYSKVLSWKS